MILKRKKLPFTIQEAPVPDTDNFLLVIVSFGMLKMCSCRTLHGACYQKKERDVIVDIRGKSCLTNVCCERQRKALEYALDQIDQSILSPYIQDIILYGSCARKEEKYSSDVDLLIEIQDGILSKGTFHDAAILLKSSVTSGELFDAETDLKIVSEKEWRNSPMTFYKNVRKDGVNIWN